MRPGFSRVDLLAVVLLLGVGSGVAAPALHQANAKQDRQTSINNLKQMALAAHNAHDTYTKLPQISGMLGKVDASLHFHLLPFNEQALVYQAADLSVSIMVMQDPGDRSAPAGGIYKRTYGTTNYVGNWLVFKGGPRAPAYGTFLQITDGLSNTLMFAERYQMCNGTPCLWGYNQYYYWAPMFAYFSLAKFQVHPPQEACDPALPQSIHREGMLVGMCDASVHTVGNNINPWAWGLMCCPDDGMPIPGDWDG
jgi:hypothetical protein